MARSVAKLKMGFYPLPESECGKLRQLLSFTGPASVVDPCVGQGMALNLITHGADVRRYGVELDAERALAASASGIETIQGNTFDAMAKPESFSLLYLNPPYDSEIGSVGNSRMERLFLEHTFRWLVMEGVLVLVIPFERLHECAGVLSSHFARLYIFRMTDDESVRFRQIAVRRERNVNALKRRTRLIEYLQQQDWTGHPSGRFELVGLCPLHEETHPSFYVNTRKDVFYCHGCRQGGDLIRFVHYSAICPFVIASLPVQRKVLCSVPDADVCGGRIDAQGERHNRDFVRA